MPEDEKPKKAHELTTEEALRRMFPEEVREKAAKEAQNARRSKDPATKKDRS